MTDSWPLPSEWPTAAFLTELRARAYAETQRILTDPLPELAINAESLRGYPLAELVIEFQGLSIRLDAGRRSHYYRVLHHVRPPAWQNGLALFWYEVEFGPDGEFWDEYFDHFPA